MSGAAPLRSVRRSAAPVEKPFQAYEGDEPFFFVSYAHADAMPVYEEMAELNEAGFRLWYDDGIHIGTVWRQALADALSKAAGMIFFSTERSNASQNCLQELNFVLDDGKPVIVVQLEEAPLPALLRLSLGDRQALRKGEFSAEEYRRKLHEALAPIAPPAGTAATRMIRLYLDVSSTGDVAEDFSEILIDVFAVLPFPLFVGVDPQLEDHRDYVLAVAVRERDAGLRVRTVLRSSEGEQIESRTFNGLQADAPVEWQVTGDLILTSMIEAMLGHVGRCERDVPEVELDALGLVARARSVAADAADPRYGQVAKERERLFDLAIAVDGNLQIARSDLVYQLLLKLEALRSKDEPRDRERILEHARHSLLINERVGMRDSILAELSFGDLEVAAKQVERMIQMAPEAYSVRTVVAGLARLGRADEAIALVGGATTSMAWMMSQAHTIVGNYETALDLQQILLARAPDAPTILANKANILGHMGRIEEGRAIWAQLVQQYPGYSRATWERGNRVSFQHEVVWHAMTEGIRLLGVD